MTIHDGFMLGIGFVEAIAAIAGAIAAVVLVLALLADKEGRQAIACMAFIAVILGGIAEVTKYFPDPEADRTLACFENAQTLEASWACVKNVWQPEAP